GGFDGLQEIFGAFLLEEVEGIDLLIGEVKDISRNDDQTAVDQLVHDLFSQRIDIEAFLGNEVIDLFARLARTRNIRATVNGFAFGTNEFGIADGAALGEMYFFFFAGAKVREHLDHFGDDIASLVDDDGVTDAHVFTVDLVFVVERGAGNGGTVEEGGAQFGDGRDGTSTPDLEDNIFDNRGRLGRREFVGDGPTRRFGRRTEPFLMFGVIDFEDDAVDAVGEVVAFFGP